MSNAIPAVITAALGLLAGYDSAMAATGRSAEPVARHECSQEILRLTDEIHKTIADAKSMEETFSAIIKASLKNDVRLEFDADGIQPLADLLNSLRGVEVGLKSASVPEELLSLHMEMRRAIAKGRARVAELYGLVRQAHTIPDVVEAKTGSSAMRALAERSTQRLIELANA